MENAIYIGLSRQMALQRRLSVAANNIANANTPGFKAQRMLFVQFLAAPDRPGPDRGDAIAMVTDRAVVRDLRAGELEQTGNPLDVALLGDGYLVVETDAGPRYTRNGRLALDAERRLVDSNELPVLGADDRPIVIPPNSGPIVISQAGDVSVDTGPVGRLRVVGFDDELGLTPLGGGLHASNEMPVAADQTEVVQGMLEGSNVQPILEMTQLIEISRQYQSTQRLLESEHRRQRDAIGRLANINRR